MYYLDKAIEYDIESEYIEQCNLVVYCNFEYTYIIYKKYCRQPNNKPTI